MAKFADLKHELASFKGKLVIWIRPEYLVNYCIPLPNQTRLNLTNLKRLVYVCLNGKQECDLKVITRSQWDYFALRKMTLDKATAAALFESLLSAYQRDDYLDVVFPASERLYDKDCIRLDVFYTHLFMHIIINKFAERKDRKLSWVNDEKMPQFENIDLKLDWSAYVRWLDDFTKFITPMITTDLFPVLISINAKSSKESILKSKLNALQVRALDVILASSFVDCDFGLQHVSNLFQQPQLFARTPTFEALAYIIIKCIQFCPSFDSISRFDRNGALSMVRLAPANLQLLQISHANNSQNVAGVSAQLQVKPLLVENSQDSLFMYHFATHWTLFYNLDRCTLLVGVTKSTLYLKHCRACIVVACANRLVLDGCDDVQLFVRLAQPPIIASRCSSITIAPFNTYYEDLDNDLRRAGLEQLIDQDSCLLNIEKPIILYPDTANPTLANEDPVYKVLAPGSVAPIIYPHLVQSSPTSLNSDDNKNEFIERMSTRMLPSKYATKYNEHMASINSCMNRASSSQRSSQEKEFEKWLSENHLTEKLKEMIQLV